MNEGESKTCLISNRVVYSCCDPRLKLFPTWIKMHELKGSVITGLFTPAFLDIEVECLPRSNYMNHAKLKSYEYHLNLYNKCKL